MCASQSLRLSGAPFFLVPLELREEDAFGPLVVRDIVAVARRGGQGRRGWRNPLRLW